MDDRLIEMTLLFDFYGKLLTPKQQEIVDLYYMKDFSLGEIAQLLMTSRQAVHDNLKRAQKQLKTLEQKLGLIERFERDRRQWTNAIKSLDRVIKTLDEQRDRQGMVLELESIRELILQAMGG